MGEGEPVCRLQGRAELPDMAKDGELVIGGIVTFQTEYDSRIPDFQSLPDLLSEEVSILFHVTRKF